MIKETILSAMGVSLKIRLMLTQAFFGMIVAGAMGVLMTKLQGIELAVWAIGAIELSKKLLPFVAPYMKHMDPIRAFKYTICADVVLIASAMVYFWSPTVMIIMVTGPALIFHTLVGKVFWIAYDKEIATKHQEHFTDIKYSEGMVVGAGAGVGIGTIMLISALGYSTGVMVVAMTIMVAIVMIIRTHIYHQMVGGKLD